MNAIVPCSWLDTLIDTVVTRINPKSASMARSGAESEMRIFGWDHGS